MRLSESDWLFINSIIYKIHSIIDFDKMRLEFLNSVRLSIDYDSDFSDTDKDKLEIIKDHMALRLAREMGLFNFQTPPKSANPSLSLICTEKDLTIGKKK